MLKSNPSRIGIVVEFFFLIAALQACVDLGIEIPTYDTDINIMPNADRYISNDNRNIPIQGEWYWYNNLGSKIEIIKAEVSLGSEGSEDTEAISWYTSKGTDDTSRDDRITKSSPVSKICIKGKLESSDNAERYVGVGFELCSVSVDDIKNAFYNFPLTLGRCRLMGDETLLRRFLGISFKIEPYPEKKDPEYTKFIVQFKERGVDLDARQPYCVVQDKMNAPVENQSFCNSVEKEGNGYRVKAWHGSATHPDRSPMMSERNPWMLQAVHFQVGSEVDSEFSFCLSDISAIATREPRSEGDFGTDVPIKLEPPPVEPLRNFDAGLDAENWANVTDGGFFEVMKREITVAQYSACIDAGICEETLNWESCNVTKFRYLIGAPLSQEKANEMKTRSANCIKWRDAWTYCKAIGGRLPNRLEWEYAAASGNTEENVFPWGATTLPNSENAVICDDQKLGCGNSGVPVKGCTKTKGNSEHDVCDLVGNLWEWVDESYPITETWQTGYKTIKGGSFKTVSNTKGDERGSRLSISNSTSLEHPSLSHNPNHLGFRCVKGPFP